MNIFIYALIDPRNNKMRYIGKTINKIGTRLSKHISNIKYESKTHKTNWIKQLLKNGLFPTIKLIEICNEENWEDRERFYIKKYRKHLTNTTDGGETPDSNIIRQYMIKKWKNEDYRKKHSGKFHHMKKKENRMKVSGKNSGMYGKHHSKESKMKISKSSMGHKASDYQKQRAKESNSHPKPMSHRKNISIAKSKSLKKYEFIKRKIDIDKMSFQQVANIIGVSLTSVWRTYNKKLKCQIY